MHLSLTLLFNVVVVHNMIFLSTPHMEVVWKSTWTSMWTLVDGGWTFPAFLLAPIWIEKLGSRSQKREGGDCIIFLITLTRRESRRAILPAVRLFQLNPSLKMVHSRVKSHD